MIQMWFNKKRLGFRLPTLSSTEGLDSTQTTLLPLKDALQIENEECALRT
jgi:hypothetical protein